MTRYLPHKKLSLIVVLFCSVLSNSLVASDRDDLTRMSDPSRAATSATSVVPAHSTPKDMLEVVRSASPTHARAALEAIVAGAGGLDAIMEAIRATRPPEAVADRMSVTSRATSEESVTAAAGRGEGAVTPPSVQPPLGGQFAQLVTEMLQSSRTTGYRQAYGQFCSLSDSNGPGVVAALRDIVLDETQSADVRKRAAKWLRNTHRFQADGARGPLIGALTDIISRASVPDPIISGSLERLLAIASTGFPESKNTLTDLARIARERGTNPRDPVSTAIVKKLGALIGGGWREEDAVAHLAGIALGVDVNILLRLQAVRAFASVANYEGAYGAQAPTDKVFTLTDEALEKIARGNPTNDVGLEADALRRKLASTRERLQEESTSQTDVESD